MSGAVAITGPARGRLRLVSFKQVRRNSLVGFCTVEIPPGLILRDLPINVGRNGRLWVALPGRPMLDETGCQVVIDGKKQYVAIGEWTSHDLSDRFSTRVLELIADQYGAEVLS